VGAVLSQREGRCEKVIAYANKALTVAQRKFHPMEGECYALIWGILHFRHYLHRTHFTLRTDHKPLEWLVTISNAHGRRGRWIDMLQDFSFKIVHRPGMRHANADTLSRNPVGQVVDDDDFYQEIQDDPNIRGGSTNDNVGMFDVQYGQDSEWLGIRRRIQGLTKHRNYCFGINHWRCSPHHKLFMLNPVTGIDTDEEAAPNVRVAGAAKDEDLEATQAKQALQKGRIRYYGKQQQLELILVAQELSGLSHHEVNLTELGKEEECGIGTECTDIWDDTTCLVLLKEGMLPDTCGLEEGKRARRRASNYYWREQKLYFKGLYVPKLEERIALVVQMHQDLGHSGEHRMSTEIYRRYF